MRIGHGFDVHRFADGQGQFELMLGGVAVPHNKKIIAHSDGDVVIHALCDALLGAIAAGDIGQHFPDTDPQYHNADSRDLLRQVCIKVAEKGYQVVNIDITIIAERPKIADHSQAMRECLAADLNCMLDQVSVKATTTEKAGFLGREEAIAAQAMVLLVSSTR